jgi:hypothetical protein
MWPALQTGHIPPCLSFPAGKGQRGHPGESAALPVVPVAALADIDGLDPGARPGRAFPAAVWKRAHGAAAAPSWGHLILGLDTDLGGGAANGSFYTDLTKPVTGAGEARAGSRASMKASTGKPHPRNGGLPIRRGDKQRAPADDSAGALHGQVWCS